MTAQNLCKISFLSKFEVTIICLSTRDTINESTDFLCLLITRRRYRDDVVRIEERVKETVCKRDIEKVGVKERA